VYEQIAYNETARSIASSTRGRSSSEVLRQVGAALNWRVGGASELPYEVLRLQDGKTIGAGELQFMTQIRGQNFIF
jgi:hypothetical protein